MGDTEIPQGNSKFGYGLMTAIGTTVARMGAQSELGYCRRESTACPDVGVGFQLSIGTTRSHIETEPTKRAHSTDFLTTTPYLRLGLLFQPGAGVSIGPVFRLGLGLNFASMQTYDASTKSSLNPSGDVSGGLFLQGGLHVMFAPRKFGDGFITFDLGAARYPEIPHAAGFFESTFIPHIQGGGVYPF